MDFSPLQSRTLKFSILSAFFLALGYLSGVFLITMYLQRIRGLSPLDASLLLIPGYVAGSLLSPYMGRMSYRYGPRILATTGTGMLILVTLIYLTMITNSPLQMVLITSGISGILRTVQNIGILGSFILAITVASAAIPRETAFQIFIGTTSLAGSVSETFLKGIDSSLVVSILLIAIAGALSWMRGESSVQER